VECSVKAIKLLPASIDTRWVIQRLYDKSLHIVEGRARGVALICARVKVNGEGFFGFVKLIMVSF
jgi:hypothetical protein